jgi:uncharacterized membrane protein YkoI
MNRHRSTIAAAIAALALIGTGAGVVLASGGDDDRPLRGTTLDKASAAALEHVGGGTVIETEVGDDGAAYGVEIRKDDGAVVEVNLDANFDVIGSEPDEDGSNEDEGPGDND